MRYEFWDSSALDGEKEWTLDSNAPGPGTAPDGFAAQEAPQHERGALRGE
jgi:hypothetical protein